VNDDILLWLWVAVAIAAIIAVNVWSRRERRKMTPEQRRQDDEETRAEMQRW
jgi:hypothetical protein